MNTAGLIFGGDCGFQYGGYDGSLNDVDIRVYRLDDWNMSDFVFWHGYDPRTFDDSQLSHLLNGGTIRHTFGHRNNNNGDWVDVDDYIIIN